jgi:hypothetical protein
VADEGGVAEVGGCWVAVLPRVVRGRPPREAKILDTMINQTVCPREGGVKSRLFWDGEIPNKFSLQFSAIVASHC